jgi:hypothetical protein
MDLVRVLLSLIVLLFVAVSPVSAQGTNAQGQPADPLLPMPLGSSRPESGPYLVSGARQALGWRYAGGSLLEDRQTHAFELQLSTYGQDAKSVYTADNWKYTLTIIK